MAGGTCSRRSSRSASGIISVGAGEEGAAREHLGPLALEFDVLKFVAKGLSNAEVGRVMELERRTVRTHLSHIYRKMGVNSHVDAV